MATIKQVANKIGNDLNESYPNVQSLFDVLKRGFKDMENVSGGGSGGSEVDWTQLQVSGTKIAEIEIDGDKTNVYVPTSQTIAVSQIQTTGTKIASISLDGVSTDLYAPNGGSASEVLATVTADGVLTYAQILNALYTNADKTKISFNSVIETDAGESGKYYGHITAHTSSYLVYNEGGSNSTSTWAIRSYTLKSSGSEYIKTSNGTGQDMSSIVAASGTIFKLYS